ncbi:MAG: hypothetical protein QM774_10735 [Gordonia sp. (in: high G+C Gram-positive bacteria)]|uniref:hypothetical protein n=1 Tax=Gordonia sp. (in: high G+C Gram-positive bacteria) TaxID=84139 RepID=UPI0039E4E7BA
MTGTITRGALVCAALAISAAGLTACGDSSTASAPLVPEVTTTSMPSPVSDKSSVPSSASASSSASKAPGSASSSKAADKPAGKPSSAAPKPPANGPDAQGQQAANLNPKEKAYLAALKRDKVSFMGDDNGQVALTWGNYVCEEQKKGTDPATIKVWVTAALGPGNNNENVVNGKTDKLINDANKNLC